MSSPPPEPEQYPEPDIFAPGLFSEPEPELDIAALEEGLAEVTTTLVSAFGHDLEEFNEMPKADRDAIRRVALKLMAKSSEHLLAQHNLPDPPHLAHVMTLACDKVLKDAMRHAPESLSDGRLASALCKLCVDYIPDNVK